jgi:uncharacterized protein (DUF2141 family)
MKNLYLLLVFVLASPSVCNAQIDLTLIIEPLRNNKGTVLLEFKNGQDELVKGISESIEDNRSTIRIKNLKTGKYAFKFFHDENSDEKINTNFMGIPREGFGFSNNAKATFGPPAFEKMLFELTKSDTIYCEPSYMLKQK